MAGNRLFFILFVSVVVMAVLLSQISASEMSRPISIRSVKREAVLQKNRFTIRFKSTLTGTKALVQEGQGVRKEINTTYQQAIYEAIFQVKNTVTNPKFIVTASPYRTGVFVYLNNTGSEEGFHSVPSIPIHSLGPQEVTYSPGQSVLVTYNMSLTGYHRRSYRLSPEFRGVALDSNSQTFFRSRGADGSFISLEDEQAVDHNYHKVTYKVDTSVRRVSGYFLVRMRTLRTGGDLIRSMTLFNKVTLKPVGQDGVVPGDFLQIKVPGCSYLRSGVTRCTCRAGQVCRLMCKAYGNNVTSLSVVHGSRRHSVPFKESSQVTLNQREIHWTLTPTVSNPLLFFECQAQSDGANSAREIFVLVTE